MGMNSHERIGKGMNLESEKHFVDNLYSTYTTVYTPHAHIKKDLVIRAFKPFIQGGEALELGCADGYMTERLAHLVDTLDVVDGSSGFLKEARKASLTNVDFICALFEEYETHKRYDYIFATYILEHVLDPMAILKRMKTLLKSSGLLFITVPNARALSRQIALHMGLIEDLKQLTDNDRKHGHRRVYDRISLNRHIDTAGFRTISQGGILLKILADFQLNKLLTEKILTEDHYDALYSLGLEYPDFCDSLFSICAKKET
jgi:2-polyprenyl-3-methyl-5-hydroxy-6-metoxy-1,4-benzoquinol methylase